jgi:ABC-type nickel/cobalt efflux system permease component RcnA
MVTLLSILIFGFFLGMRHATDPDHVIAVATLVTKARTVWSAARLGMLWALGHTMTILLVGGAIIVFGIVIPPRAGLSLEFAVAVMLIILGVANLKSVVTDLQATVSAIAVSPTRGIHWHVHTHGGHRHSHPHQHGPEDHSHDDVTPEPSPADCWPEALTRYQRLRPLVVGVVHGLAGSAALALLVLTTIPSPLWAVGYLLVFGLGTIIGMMVITAAIGAPLAYSAQRFARVHRYLGVTSGVLSLIFGLFLAYEIGIVGGLFTGQPNWTPR